MSPPPDNLNSAARASVIEELSTLVREVLSFGTAMGTSVAQLDGHKDTLDSLKKTLEHLLEEEKKKNELKAQEERRLEARGGRDHEFRMRVLHGFGGLLTGSLVPAILYYTLGFNPTASTNCPPSEVQHGQNP